MTEKPPGPHPPIVRWVLLPTLLTLAGGLGGVPIELLSYVWGRGEAVAPGAAFGLAAAVATALGGPWILRAAVAVLLAFPSAAVAFGITETLRGGRGIPDLFGMMKGFLDGVVLPLIILPPAVLAGCHRLLEIRWGRPHAVSVAFLGYALAVGAAGLAAVELGGRLDAAQLVPFFASLGAVQALGMALLLRISQVYRGRERS